MLTIPKFRDNLGLTTYARGDFPQNPPMPECDNWLSDAIFVPEGRRPEGTAAARGKFLTEVEAAISLYIARRDPIYIIYISLFM